MTNQNKNTSFFSGNRFMVLLSLAVLIGVSLLYFYCWFMGNNQVINWQVLSELGNTNAIIDRFQSGNQAFEIPAKVYYVTEQYVASNMAINELAAHIWLAFFVIAISFMAASVTQLNNYWYYGSMAVLLLVLARFSFDVIFSSSGFLYSALILGVFIVISYFFFGFKNEVNLWLKFVVFLLFFLTIGILVYYFAKDEKPFLYLAINTIPSATVLSSIFIFGIAYEIVLAILTISTKGGDQKSLINFAIGTFIYLLNISLTYLHNINYLQWDILYFSPFLLLIISIGLGLWGLQKKEALFTNISTSFSSIFVLYCGLSIITLGFISFAFATANDPLLEAIEDAIIYSHLVMGLLFFCYVFLNFFPLFKQKLDVAKVVFKPLQYAIIYFRAAAVLVIFAMLVNNEFFPVMQGFAGFYNGRADHAMATKEYKLAEAYYKTALGYERQNHKSNYALASLSAIQGDNATAGSYFRLAIQKKPTAYAFAALSNTLQNEDLFFDAMFALKDGLKKYPNSGELQNNLALLFSKSKAPDSTLKYLKLAKINAENSNIPEANILSFWIKNGDKSQQLEALNKAPNENYNALNANYEALNLILEKKSKNKFYYIFDKDSTLNMANYAFMNNEVLNKKGGRFPFQKVIDHENNFNLADDLRMTYFFNEYYRGNKIVALEILQNQLSTDSTDNSKYKQLLFNTLLKKTKEEEPVDALDFTNQWSTLAILDKFPLNEKILKKSVIILNKEANSKGAYEALIAAKKWLPESAEIQKMYILQCFKINMAQYAKDGMASLKSMNTAEYNSFLPVYQAQLSLMEKQTDGFN